MAILGDISRIEYINVISYYPDEEHVLYFASPRLTNESLLGYWTFDETGSVAIDSSNNEKDGELLNGTSRSAGINGTGVVFDGLNDYVEIDDAVGTTDLRYTGGSMTLTAWINIDPWETNSGSIISKVWNGSGEFNYRLEYGWDQRPYFILQNQGFIISPTALSADTWHHLAATVDNDKSMKLYVDGVEVASGYHDIDDWVPAYGDLNLPLAIGTVYPYGDSWAGGGLSMEGTIDEVAIYARALSAEEMKAIVYATGYWKFDDFSTEVIDASRHGHTGELMNGIRRVAGRTGTAIALDGINDYVEVADTPDLKYTGDGMTVAAWLYIDPEETTSGSIISKVWNGSGEFNYRLEYGWDQRPYFYLQNQGFIVAPEPLPKDSWHHVAATVDTRGLMKIFVDGVEVVSGVHSIADWTPVHGDLNLPLAIGTVYPYGDNWAGGGLCVDGKIDDVAIYPWAMSDEEIAAISQ